MSTCESCHHWTIKRETMYGDGAIIENWKAEDGKGACESLVIETAHDFGCNRYIEGGGDHVTTARKDGHPWQHFVMIPCPDCGGKGDGGRGHRCAGTGLVRLYDDGYVGDEQTRLHPNEKPLPSTCPACSANVDRGWAHCPSCGAKLWKVAETEVIGNEAAGLPPDPVRLEDDWPEHEK
jgi:hypothetical protein